MPRRSRHEPLSLRLHDFQEKLSRWCHWRRWQLRKAFQHHEAKARSLRSPSEGWFLCVRSLQTPCHLGQHGFLRPAPLHRTFTTRPAPSLAVNIAEVTDHIEQSQRRVGAVEEPGGDAGALEPRTRRHGRQPEGQPPGQLQGVLQRLLNPCASPTLHTKGSSHMGTLTRSQTKGKPQHGRLQHRRVLPTLLPP